MLCILRHLIDVHLLHNTLSVEISRMRVGMPRVCTLVLFISIVVHVVKHQSVLINTCRSKAVEPENDAGPKHNYSQLNCSCYSYPSKPRIVFF